MRNLIAILAVLAMGVNSMAAITFVATDNTDGTATVAWTSDEGVAGMALEMTVTTGGADLAVTMNDFNVFIDEAFSIVDGGGTLTELPASNPVANADAAGTAAAAGTFVVCGGYLAENNPGLMAGSIVLSASEDTTLDVVADATRGGVVALGGAALAVDPFTVTITLPTGCKGDANGDGKISPADMAAIVAFVSPAYAGSAYTVDPVPAGMEDFDANGDGKISPADMAAIVSFLSPAYAGSAYTYEGCMP